MISRTTFKRFVFQEDLLTIYKGNTFLRLELCRTADDTPTPEDADTIPNLALPSTDLELELDSAITGTTNFPVTSTRKDPVSSILQNKWRPFEPPGNRDATSKAAPPVSGIPRPVEPLAIKKNSSLGSVSNHEVAGGSPPHIKDSY